MTSEIPATPRDRISADPRNVWARLSAAMDCIGAQDLHQAALVLDTLRHNPALAPDLLATYQRHLSVAQATLGRPGLLNLPEDYLRNRDRLLRPPLRRLSADRDVPVPYPFGMALPAAAGPVNDYRFLEDAATTLEAALRPLPCRVQVVWAAAATSPPGALARLAASLAAQSFSGADVSLWVFGSPADLARAGQPAPGFFGRLTRSDQPLLSPGGAAPLAAMLERADLVLFLSGGVTLDEMALARAVRLAKVSDRVVQPLVAAPPADRMSTPFTPAISQAALANRSPFRDMNGLNFAAPASALRDIARTGRGLFDPRFTTLTCAARHLAFLLCNRGCYFAPLCVPDLSEFLDADPGHTDHELFRELCPGSSDRNGNLAHEVPKVSICIPAWNAASFLAEAVDSVLAQDFSDLEVCIADDGSGDATLQILQLRYGNEPRVRWVSGRNGGIGFASNRAVGLSRGLYVGQLEADDRLKPGAVRRLADHLDAHPQVVCAYSSAERIDASGNRLENEFNWPVFSREKMAVTSITHHFRMFRRMDWERTARFREDIVNAVDYDIFLKLAELGPFHHIDELLYQRRWHGGNTSQQNEAQQTANTHRVQQEALTRQGLAPFWDVHVPDPEKPRSVGYRQRDGHRLVLFWPDYSLTNPYQKLLYAKAGAGAEFVAGDIDAALRVIDSQSARAQDVTFHLHWLNFVFRGCSSPYAARQATLRLTQKLQQFKALGGQVVWTVHNTLTHDSRYRDLEAKLSAQVAALADVLHFHSAGSVAEAAQVFAVPGAKVRVSRHGHYIGAYPDYVPRDAARRYLGIDSADDVILFTDLVRPYKGVQALAAAFRNILATRPQALLVIAGHEWFEPLASLTPVLTTLERSRIRTTGRFTEDAELGVFFRAADIAAYPYQQILTSGSLLLALGFGVPTVVPDVAMTREVLGGGTAGRLYDSTGGLPALEGALRDLLTCKDQGTLTAIGQNAEALARSLDWPDFSPILARSGRAGG